MGGDGPTVTLEEANRTQRMSVLRRYEVTMTLGFQVEAESADQATDIAIGLLGEGYENCSSSDIDTAGGECVLCGGEGVVETDLGGGNVVSRKCLCGQEDGEEVVS